jgi:hypothetical protein
MPAVSKAQQKFMGMVHAAHKGEEPASPEVAKAAASMSKGDAKDFASTKHKGLPDKKDEIARIKEQIRKIVREKFLKEMNATGNVQGYATPFAFGKKSNEKEKGKKQADLTGYSVVNEASNLTKILRKLGWAGEDWTPKEFANQIKKLSDETLIAWAKSNKGIGKGIPNTPLAFQQKLVGIEMKKRGLKESLNENRWLELRNEESPAKVKIDKGISGINKQLAEIEKFLNWYGRLKQESGITNENFWKRTNRNIYTIKERLIKLEQKIRKISE